MTFTPISRETTELIDAAWWTVVGFGPCSNRGGLYSTRDAASHRRISKAVGDWSLANSRVYAYSSRAGAMDGDISDDIGTDGRIK